MTRRLRLTLLGVGAMASPRFAPAGLLVAYGRRRVAFDGGPGAQPPEGRLDAWLVTDEHAELRSALRHLAAERGLVPRMTDTDLGELRIRALPVAHTSHPTCGYRIEGEPGVVVWAPEFRTFPAWAADADLMFAEASSWDRPIRFRGGVGGHAPVRDVGAEAARNRVGRLVYAHIGRPCLRAMDAGLTPEHGEWGREGRTYVLPPRRRAH
ncbi:MBL fold metallo-hydrolase [Streptomyces sp. NPDC059680]|uniref:MBL fold metallo-hydrolase n=1 Tax=Streptomyces TaxID=1883 RepID=UPI001E440AE8|nr:MBL fold metallo-hydrolase [Streptomyces barringtoniae]MCC5477773.1 MBL fold metallo-hydrolase [Streptomyces barringtoniae]